MSNPKLASATLLTSNEDKLREFQAHLGDTLKMSKGKDIKEIDAESELVALYKSLEAGANTIVEDTVLIINGKEVVDIRYKLDSLQEIQSIPSTLWQVMLAFNDGEHIHLFRGVTVGILKAVESVPDDAFGFDANFFPVGAEKSLYELDKADLKKNFSARNKALDNMANWVCYQSIKINEIAPWQGDYQE